MRRTASLLIAALSLGLSGPAMAHSGGPARDGATPSGHGLPVLLVQNACHSRIFEAGEQPAFPLSVTRITCLDASCDTRAITLCPLSD